MGKLCRGKISHKRVTVGTVLYYCNAVFVGSLRHITDKLQCIPNAAAHLVTGTCKFDHGLSHLLHEELHWLDIPERIHYKLGVTVHRCLQYKALEYMVDCCTPADIIYGQLLDITWLYNLTSSALSVLGPSLSQVTVWNLLQDSVRDPALSSNSLRQSLKTNLFCRYHSAHTAQ